MAGKRSIFEEVGAGAKPAPAVGGMIDAPRRGARGAIRVWLVVLFALVVVMIAVGGLTRLQDAGLSITEWKPVTGALPPMDAAGWEAEFAKYQAIPQYQLQTEGMVLAEFKSIYWWEWGHRQLGRLIGLVWALGFFGFLLARQVPLGWTGRLFGVGAMIGVQGAVGWWMVASGLTGAMTSVASTRLAVHLGLAFVILGVIANFVLLLGRSEAALLQARRVRVAGLALLATGLAGLALVQILLGALVAGIDAGRGFTDWPLMAGQFFPPGAFDLTPWWSNFIENPGLVQFVHRMAGYGLFAVGIAVWLVARRSVHGAVRRAFGWVAVMLVGQVALGIFTVLTAATLHLALTHQLGAVLLWVLILRARHLAYFPVVELIRRG